MYLSASKNVTVDVRDALRKHVTLRLRKHKITESMQKYTRNPRSRHVSQSRPLKNINGTQIFHPSQGRRLVHGISDVEINKLENVHVSSNVECTKARNAHVASKLHSK